MSKAQATHSAMDILPYSDREILTEANEITLDFDMHISNVKNQITRIQQTQGDGI